MRFVFIIVLSALAFCNTGCNIINPKEDMPTYVRIDSVGILPSGLDSFGSNAHNIVGVTAYYNNNPLGTFDLPATIPFLAKDGGTLSFQPVVQVSGLPAFGAYPFFTFDTKTVPADSMGKIIKYTPHSRYMPTAKMVFYTNFETGVFDNNFILSAGDTTMVKTQDPQFVFEGKSAGLMFFDRKQKASNVISTRSFKLTAGTPAWLELNYKCSVPFYIGLFSSNTALTIPYIYNVGVNTKYTWNKMYVNLGLQADQSQTINFITGDNTYYVIFYSYTTIEESSGWVAVDNIKVITQ